MAEVKRILLVDDDAKDVELILAALDEHHLANSVDVAWDGEEALEYLFRRGRFEARSDVDPVVVMLDLKMPKVDGLEVLRQVKSDPKLKIIPIVALTSSREAPDLAKCYDLSVNSYVVKPVDFQQFADAVKKIGLFWAVVNECPPDTSYRA